MTALILGLIGFALGALAALARLRAGRTRSANRVSLRTLARLRQAQEEDR